MTSNALRIFLWPTVTVLLSMSVGLSIYAMEFPVQKASELKIPQGFKAEKLIDVPGDYASLINFTFDPQGRIIASSTGKGLLRITPAPLGQAGGKTHIERLDVEIGAAHGLTYAFGSLYAVTAAGIPDTGVFRLKDLDGKGNFAAAEMILKIPGQGEHGGHGIVVGPQNQWLYFIAGNATQLPKGITRNHVSSIEPTEFMKAPAHQGFVMRISPDGKKREVFAHGLRNSFDIAFDQFGELFTYDSDNEGFMGLPWYRPTNLYHLTNGADLGWRQSEDNLQSYYPDNPPPVREVGPGSPTGIAFGYEADFPMRFANALFACDWSYGHIYALHLQQDGASYSADWEFFISGQPLPVTDIAVGNDGALYFTTGGRGNPSQLYRVYYDGPVDRRIILNPKPSEVVLLRRQLESFHRMVDPKELKIIWANLDSPDRAVRYAARVALEYQPIASWSSWLDADSSYSQVLEACIVLARKGDLNLKQKILDSVEKLPWSELNHLQRHAAIRVLNLASQRMGSFTSGQRDQVLRVVDRYYPSQNKSIDRELATLLFNLGTEDFVDRTLTVLENSDSMMQQIHYLRMFASTGVEGFTAQQKQRLRDSLDVGEFKELTTRKYRAQSEQFAALAGQLGISLEEDVEQEQRPVVAEWTLEDLMESVDKESLKSAVLSSGKSVFRSARCDNCHRVGSSGGVLGPNLNGLAGRYAPAVVLDHVLNPSKVIAPQYAQSIFILKSGQQVTGQIVNLGGDNFQVRVDPFKPFARQTIRRSDVEQIVRSKTSLMPTGLLNTFTRHEIRDLIGYLLSPDEDSTTAADRLDQ